MSQELVTLLATLEKVLAEISPGEVPDLIGALRRLEVRAEAIMVKALIQSDGRSVPPAAKEEDRWLSAEEAATLLGLTPQQLSRRRNIPRKKIGHRTVRYSLVALKRYLARA